MADRFDWTERREKRARRMLADGATREDVAQSLGCSRRTLFRYLSEAGVQSGKGRNQWTTGS